MDPVRAEALARGQRKQREHYGEPLGVTFGRIMKVLELNQTRLAAVLGQSQAMLSQLISGFRVLMQNPSVQQRAHLLGELADEVAAGRVSREDAIGRLEEIRAVNVAGFIPPPRGANVPGDPTLKRAVRDIQGLLRSLASGPDLLNAVALLEGEHPEIAEVLRVYGTGRTRDALAHFTRHQ
ncbi:DNA-binding protein [Streptomyces sp. YC504]|uniref:DNA-binding protein n=1 Tax=Streptomyces mesophilus TaxID=1775132 RepID=A0A6G4XK51_9ACTN|nr:DNA-binding protein [Streptomyces mesophilus]NGO77210.1 DNA-binding protein [Streptomyces mesophilus]